MEQYSHSAFDEIMSDPENKLCIDCGIYLFCYLGAKNPLWVSINNAVFVCMKCSGVHRGFGVNISFIRSMTIDTW